MNRPNPRRLYLCIDIFDDFVEIFEPFVGILVLKVTAHGHDDVIGSESNRLWESDLVVGFDV